jgi:hypothetical protein
MKSSILMRSLAAAVGIVALPGVAFAQMAPGAELVGQPLQVTTNGVSNTVYLDAGGTARIVTPGGATIPGTWTAASGQLCLSNGAAQECWPYATPFQAGLPQTLTSSCASTSTWLAQATNQPAPMPRGERGK